MTDLVRFDRVSLGYGRQPLLRDLTFRVAPGELLGLVGPNGSGKTTVLRGLLGTLPPLHGTIDIAPGVSFGYVPQREQIDSRYPLQPAEMTWNAPVLTSLAAMYAPMDSQENWIKSVCVGMIEGGCEYFKAHQPAGVWDGQLGNIGSSTGYFPTLR